MKVPYLNKKITNEFDIYLNELEALVISRIAETRSEIDSSKIFFKNLYPLFVLLRGLSSSEYVGNPVRSAVLNELAVKGDKKRYIEALSHFNKRQEFQDEMHRGLQNQLFTGYFNELLSDMLLLLNSFYTCNYRGALIAIRCMLEDLYRHLYYKDHPQEYWAMTHDGASSHFSPKNYRDYLPRTSFLKVFASVNTKFEAKLESEDGEDREYTDLFALNESLYGQCSVYVHGAADETLNSFKSNQDLVSNPSKIKIVSTVSKQFSEMAVAFLISAHIEHYVAFNEYEKSIVLSGFPPNVRAAFRKTLNV